MKIDLKKTEKFISGFKKDGGSLITLLQEVQDAYGWIPPEAVKFISGKGGINPVEIYEVLTFYGQFRLEPPGRHTIKVCQGTACHVMGGGELLDYLCGKFKINVGGTTEDGKFSLERVACLGCCGMAPVIVVDGDFYGTCTIQKAEEFLKKYK